MHLSEQDKQSIRRGIVECLSGEPEVCRIVIFGSFVRNSHPNDLDLAIFQDTNETYFPLAMKYRKLLRPVANRIPVDVLPFRSGVAADWFVRDR